MRLGFFLPQMGPAASAENMVTVAKRAEELGYETLWVTERLLFPVSPRSPYPSPDGSLPDVYKIVLDPKDIAGDLFDLTRGERAGRRFYDQITLFKSVGTALEDLAAAQLVAERV